MRCLILVLASTAYLLGCSGGEKIVPLESPSSNTLSGLKSYNRYKFKGYLKTNQEVEKGDMVLIFASGAGETVNMSSYGFKLKIGRNTSYNPLGHMGEFGTPYGYFMSSHSGKLSLFYEFKYSAKGPKRKERYCKVDVFIFPESNERYIFEILKKFVSKNSEDYLFQSQVDRFIYEYQWLVYTNLEIQTTPSKAKVFLDGKQVGKAPLELNKINKHEDHEICLQLGGYSDHCESFSPKEKSNFNIVLKKMATDEKQKAAQYEYIHDSDPPVIIIKEPQITKKDGKLTISEYKIKIAGNAKDKNGIVWVKVNGATANLDANGDFWLITPLAVGINDIEIHALDTRDNLAKENLLIERSPIHAKEDSEYVTAVQNETKKIDFGKYSALVIGNNNYEKMPQLHTAVSDAKSIAQVLENYYGFQVKVILNGTRREILFNLDKFRSKLDENDNFLIYYAGHGFFDKGANRGYWLPVNADTDTSAEWISNADITDKLKAIKAKHVIVIADSCYSGTLTRGLKVLSKDSGYLNKMAKKRTRTVLTSGGLEPVLDSAGGQHSVFAKALLDVLHNNEGIIDGTKLFSEMRRPVMLNSPQTPQYSDIRFAGHEGGDFLFVRRK
jgi:hypothetical protein